MKYNFEYIGNHVELIDRRNRNQRVSRLLGLSIDKIFIPSVANTIGTDMSNYKVLKKGEFACSLMQVRRDKKIPVAILKEFDEAIISQAYPTFRIIDENKLIPDYLMMWMRRPEFDREACFYAVGGVRGSLDWEDFCDMKLPVPSIEKQRAIVKEYQIVVDRIRLNEQLNQKLEETAQAIYRHWFVEPDGDETVQLREHIEFNPKHSINKGTLTTYVEMSDVREDSLSIRNTTTRGFTSGSKFQNNDTLLARITPCLENGKTAFVNCPMKRLVMARQSL